MAERGKKIPEETRIRIQRLSKYEPIRKVARMVNVSRNTVRKVVRTSS